MCVNKDMCVYKCKLFMKLFFVTFYRNKMSKASQDLFQSDDSSFDLGPVSQKHLKPTNRDWLDMNDTGHNVDFDMSSISPQGFVGETPANSSADKENNAPTVTDGPSTSTGKKIGGFKLAVKSKRLGLLSVNCLSECVNGDKREQKVNERSEVTRPAMLSAAALEHPAAAYGIQNNKSCKHAKPGSLFLVTVSWEGDLFLCIRERFLETVQVGFGLNFISYLVAVEKSDEVRSSVNHHIHAFLEFEKPIFVTDLSDYLRMFYDMRIDCQPCRSKRNAVKYCSKEDRDLLTNIKTSELHMNFRLHMWASQTNSFKFTDPFVVEHRHQYNFLKKYFEDHKKLNAKTFGGYRQYVGPQFNGWHEAVCSWWNEWMRILSYNKRVIKRRQLYLSGPTNVGKTTVWETLVGKSNMKFVFYPGVGNFFMQGFDPAYHKYIVFEEFDLSFYPVSMLKRLLEGKTFAYPVKCQPDLVMKFVGPIIFVSNFMIDTTDNALKQRFFEVHAGHGFWGYGEAPFPPYPVKRESEYDEIPQYPLWDLLEGETDDEN